MEADPITSKNATIDSKAPIAAGWMNTINKKKKATNPLPLDWTRVKRRRPNSSNNSDDEDCCAPLAFAMTSATLPPDRHLVEGVAIWCLHQPDPSWFQGYFFPSSSKTTTAAWGLLAVQEEIDDCLRSADGGYRAVTLTVNPFQTTKKKVAYTSVDWTGGEMVQLTGRTVSFQPSKLLTGQHAAPKVEQFFQSILQKCRSKLEDDDASVLELMPDVAIVIGPMKLVMPKPKHDNTSILDD
ncbi:expressed unknown protein [Seminavis robusta]|uniref:Uncharacterized protein n=1 Tax=Seminavis robusta TaxID=568900 RepID=A0A9N8HEN2_9STRA|nr:expressed unknown protein [Seminavis robusta]|eukprot:Sro393_g133490.1 n/a (240) ;mRNA; r:6024-6743